MSVAAGGWVVGRWAGRVFSLAGCHKVSGAQVTYILAHQGSGGMNKRDGTTGWILDFGDKKLAPPIMLSR